MAVLQTGAPARVEATRASGRGRSRLHALGFRGERGRADQRRRLDVGRARRRTPRGRDVPPETERRLEEFAELVALGVASAQAREELAASRLRIVEASDAERRRIERNLHDGAQQRLVALSVALRLAQAKLPCARRAAELLDVAAEELAQALAELRELAQGIHRQC